MKIKLSPFFLLLLMVACSNSSKTSDFERKIDGIKQTIPTISENQTFAFTMLSENVWNWQKSQEFVEIDSVFLVDFIDKPQQLIAYNYYYQTNYYYKIVDFQNNDYFNLIILQQIHNNNESYMYLLQFDKQGIRKKELVLASIFKSPDEYEELYSTIQGNKITTYRYYVDDEAAQRDTTVIFW